MLNFKFSEKGLGLVSLPHFAYVFFQEKCFSCYILLTDQISLSDSLYFLRYWTISVLQLFAVNLKFEIKSEINLIFLIKPFSYMSKKSRKNLSILRTKRAFEMK